MSATSGSPERSNRRHEATARLFWHIPRLSKFRHDLLPMAGLDLCGLDLPHDRLKLRVAPFLDVTCLEEGLAAITQEVGFAAMKANAQRLLPGADEAWKGGAQTFLFKGSNGRWRGVLSPEELELYEQKAAEVLTPEYRAWLEGQGGLSARQ